MLKQYTIAPIQCWHFQRNCLANEEGGNFYHFPLFVLQGRRISALQSLSILLIKGSVAGVASDLHLYPPLLASSPREEAAQCTGLEPGHRWAMTTRGRIAVLSCSLLGSLPLLFWHLY